jgi:hypothetical protein
MKIFFDKQKKNSRPLVILLIITRSYINTAIIRAVPEKILLRFDFFAWWKRHLRVYHLIARRRYGLMVQILAGLITYLLLAIHCHENHGEPVSIKRVR